MRPRYSNNSGKQKEIARKHYAHRQIDKWVKWSMETRGYIKYKELVELHDHYNIKCYG